MTLVGVGTYGWYGCSDLKKMARKLGIREKRQLRNLVDAS
jgi:hypothetical protein